MSTPITTFTDSTGVEMKLFVRDCFGISGKIEELWIMSGLTGFGAPMRLSREKSGELAALLSHFKAHGYLPRPLGQERPELTALIAKAKAIYDALTPSQKAAHDYEQKRSFVRGQCPTNRDYLDWCRQVDAILPPLKKEEGLE